MNHIQSPFHSDIPQCRKVLRRLRKKIYKYTAVHRQTKKPKETTHDILGVLKSRNLPSFVTDALKKKRVIDLSNFKNIQVPPCASLEAITSMTDRQELEVSKLFEMHKARLGSAEKKLQSLSKLERKSTNYSSTDGEEFSSLSMEAEELREDQSRKNDEQSLLTVKSYD